MVKVFETVNRNWFTYILLGVVSFVLTSCLGKDSDSDLSSECALLTFSIADIQTPKTITLEDGRDSTFTVSTAVSNYVFSIDQINRLVYNIDSIPYGVQTEKVVVKSTASTSATIYYDKDGESTAFSSGDTLNLTQSLVFTVVSQDKKYSRDYTVTLNVHRVSPGESSWRQVTAPADLQRMKADVSDIEADFLAAHPAEKVFAFRYPLKTNTTIMRNIVVCYDVASTDSLAHVWTRLSTEPEWQEMYPSTDNPYGCPLLENLMVIRYNGDLYAFGGRSKGGRTPAVEAFERMFVSVDNGITWRKYSDKLSLPEELLGYNGAFDAAVDDDDFLWIVLADGTAWRGKLKNLN